MSDCHSHDVKGNTSANQSNEADLEKQRIAQPSASEPSISDADVHTPFAIVVSNGELKSISEVSGTPHQELLPQKELLSTTSSSDEQCRYSRMAFLVGLFISMVHLASLLVFIVQQRYLRVGVFESTRYLSITAGFALFGWHHLICQQEKEEILIDLGCLCRGGLAKAHRTCIDTWFHTKGSNRCEICQVVASNVSPPQSHHGTNYWIWRIDPTYRTQRPERYCCSPLWLAFAILIGGLLLDILVSITLGISALPVNIVIGVIVVLGLGTVFRLALEFFQEWNSSRGSQRVESNVTIGYFPAI